MGSFGDFIRYGLPGYLYIASLFFWAATSEILPSKYSFYKDFAAPVGAIVLVLGPLLGFLIHQIYFAYFDWKESYTKHTRNCISIIYEFFINSDKFNDEIDKGLVKKYTFIAWKFLTTNFEDNIKVDDLFIKRLRSLRNFSHSFGAIITSTLLSLFSVLILSCIVSMKHPCFSGGFVAFLLLTLFLFSRKRKEVMIRINELEETLALLWKDRFINYIGKLIQLETINMDVLSVIRKKK